VGYILVNNWDWNIANVFFVDIANTIDDNNISYWKQIVMPKFDNYYIVEFRIPIRVDDVDNVMSAVSIANRICERQHGFKPDNWYARVFEYSVGEKVIGHVREYFYNPNSTSSREITKNIGHHNDLVSRGEVPADIIELNKKMIEEEQEID
jgi:hypothetical protein